MFHVHQYLFITNKQFRNLPYYKKKLSDESMALMVEVILYEGF